MEFGPEVSDDLLEPEIVGELEFEPGNKEKDARKFRAYARAILSRIKHRERKIKLKRRWLLDIPPSKSERKKLRKFNFFQNEFLSESLLRKDDLFYESVRTHVEGAFGRRAPCFETENDLPQDDMHLIRMPDMKLERLISSCLDILTTKGLYLLAAIVTNGSVKSEKTRCSLTKIIKGFLSSVLDRKRHNHHQLEIRKQIFQILSNPQHFRDKSDPLSALTFQSRGTAVRQVLHGLQNLPSQTLIAMRGKLKGVKAHTPQLQPRKHGWGRDHLIKLVEKISMKMLSQLDGGNELQEPLAKAMAVADLSLKLATGCHNIFAKEFYQFSPEVKSLQNDIMNAIWSVKKVVTVPVLRNLQLLVEPKAKISNRCLRTAFVNFLTELLFECSDMDIIPKFVSQMLDVIDRNSNSTHNVLFQEKYIEEEVDYILSVSAQTKQIVLDLLPDHEYDQEFTDAYVEELEESDDSNSDVDDDETQLQGDRRFANGTSNSMDLSNIGESMGDFAPFEFHPSTSMKEENVSFFQHTASDSGKLPLPPKNYDMENLESTPQSTPRNMSTNQFHGESTEHFTCTVSKNYNSSAVSPDRESNENVFNIHDLDESNNEVDPRDASHLFCEEIEPTSSKRSICKNQYLAIQDACDKTSMLAYNLVGHLLGEFSIAEGLDLNLSSSLYLSGGKPIEDLEETEEQSSSEDARCSTVVRAVKELIPSFPDSAMEKLKMLMSL